MADVDLCADCPPVGYPTDKTRCSPCPRRTNPMTDEPRKSSSWRWKHGPPFPKDGEWDIVASEVVQ